MPASRKAASFTVVVGTAAASAARWLSRVAMITRPARALRTPWAARIDRPRKARQNEVHVVAVVEVEPLEQERPLRRSVGMRTAGSC